MGREIRMVPPNWEHPERDPDKNPYRHTGYQPMFDETFAGAFEQWLSDFDRIRAGDLTDFERECYPRGLADWLNDDGRALDPDYYRPWADEEATWFQVWETVSEGTPVSPPFATEEELIQYLADNGDFWDQKRSQNPHDAALFGLQLGKSGWGREAAERFVKGKWAPSLVVQGGVVTDGKLANLSEPAA